MEGVEPHLNEKAIFATAFRSCTCWAQIQAAQASEESGSYACDTVVTEWEFSFFLFWASSYSMSKMWILASRTHLNQSQTLNRACSYSIPGGRVMVTPGPSVKEPLIFS